jgi:hypothetical protein
MFLGAIILCNCSGGLIDVGPGGGGAAGASGAANGAWAGSAGSNSVNGGGDPSLACTDNTPLEQWPSSDGCVATSNLAIAGTWHGYLEGESGPWGELTLVIKGASTSGGVCGTLRVGAGPAPAPATNPHTSYPDPNVDTSVAHILNAWVAGYPHTLLSGSTDGTRVQFSIARSEAYRSWCALQDPYLAVGNGSCTCLPSWVTTTQNGTCLLTDPVTGKHLQPNCGQLELCSGSQQLCACNAQGCDAARSSDNLPFDLRFNGDQADGVGNSGRAFFTRVPN